jgi:glycosyltransferase involved in cell wall biosynthesis
MNIIWLNKRNWKHEGPIVHVALQNAYSFTRLGMNSHFVVGAGEESPTEDDLIDYYGITPSSLMAVHRIPRGQRGRNKTSSKPVFDYAARLARQLSSKSHVVIISRDSGFLPAMARLCRHRHVHCYYELHDCYADLSWRENKVRFRDRREQILEWMFLRSIDGLICITDEMKKQYDRLFPRIKKIHVPLGTTPAPEQDIETMRKRRTVLYVGHLSKAKGFQRILDIAPLLKQHGINILCLGGYPNSVEKLKKSLTEHALENVIRVVPFQSPTGMNRTIQSEASIGLSLLEDMHYNRYLTCPVKVLDYLSHGLPVVATNLPSNRELLGDHGHYVDLGSPEALAGAVIDLLDQADVFRQAVEKSRQRAAQLTWTTRAIKLAEFFKTNHKLIPDAAISKRKVIPASGT